MLVGARSAVTCDHAAIARFCLLAGCATYADRLAEVRGAYYAGDLAAADAAIAAGLAAEQVRRRRAAARAGDGPAFGGPARTRPSKRCGRCAITSMS